MQVSCNGEPARTLPWSTADYFEMESDANWLLAECGVAARPPGRLWLLRPPHGFSSLDATLSWLSASAKEAGLVIMANRPFVLQVEGDLGVLFTSGTWPLARNARTHLPLSCADLSDERFARRYPRPVDAERTEWSVESWARRTRFTAVVILVAVSIGLAVLVPGVGAWLSGVLMVVAALWFWLPVVLRSGRKFAEGYQSGP
jgi:hypothetical protein